MCILEIVRITKVNLAAGVSAPHKPPVILEHGAGAPCVEELALLALVQVKADHLVLKRSV